MIDPVKDNPDEGNEPEWECLHYWRYVMADRVYRCACGAEQSGYPFGPATYKD